MGRDTGISWTEATWNPWRGCTKVSAGCDNCYMFRDQRRYGRDPEVVVRAAPATFQAPLKWREGRLIFTCSWSDWFHVDADPWRDEAWDVVRRCPQHTFQILTKRPGRIRRCLPSDWDDGWPNVWLGVSVESAEFLNRIRVLRETPAALRFVSAEPLLRSLVPNRVTQSFTPGTVTDDNDGAAGGGRTSREPASLDFSGIDWVIVGGESGSRAEARPMHPDWAREIREAVSIQNWRRRINDIDAPPDICSTPIAFHFKQWGSWALDEFGRDPRGMWVDPNGGVRSSLAADAYDDLPDGSVRMRYAGPKPTSGGKMLDGVAWQEIPERRGSDSLHDSIPNRQESLL